MKNYLRNREKKRSFFSRHAVTARGSRGTGFGPPMRTISAARRVIRTFVTDIKICYNYNYYIMSGTYTLKTGPYRKRKGRRKSKLARIESDVRRLKRTAIPELQHLDIPVGSLNLDWSGSIASMNSIDRGTGEADYTGNSYLNNRLRVRWIAAPQSAANGAFRVMVVNDKSNTISTISDFLTAAGTNTATLSEVDSDRLQDVKVLYDRTYIINNYNNNYRKGYIDLKLRDMKTTTDNTTATAIETNAIKLVVFSNIDSAAASSSKYSFAYRARYYFRDA